MRLRRDQKIFVNEKDWLFDCLLTSQEEIIDNILKTIKISPELKELKE